MTENTATYPILKRTVRGNLLQRGGHTSHKPHRLSLQEDYLAQEIALAAGISAVACQRLLADVAPGPNGDKWIVTLFDKVNWQ